MSVKEYCNLYVYHIKHNGNVIYVGSSIDPVIREANHYSGLRSEYDEYTLHFTGPFTKKIGLKIESAEILRHSGPYLNNIRIPKNKADKSFFIENFNKKSEVYIRKNGRLYKFEDYMKIIKDYTCSPEMRELILSFVKQKQNVS